MLQQEEFHFEKSKGIKIRLTEEQRKQISRPEFIEASLEKENIFAYDVYKNTKLIGFLRLRKYSDTGYFLWDYAIDDRVQNLGYGTRVLKYLFLFLKTQFHATELSTTYLWGNAPARHVYEKTGFVETDVVLENDAHEVDMIKIL